MTPFVYLVGAGPGDPQLLTLRAAALLGRADVIVVDSQLSEGWRRHSRRQARIRPVHGSAEAIRVLREEVAKGDLVVRLYRGDPLLFNSAGAEGAALAEAGVSFEIVPGLSDTAVASFIGVAPTGTDDNRAVHLYSVERSALVDDAEVLRPGTSIYSTLASTLPLLGARLQQTGYSADAPASLVRRYGTSGQTTRTGTLSEVCGGKGTEADDSPVVLLVGDRAGVDMRLSWFERRPLFGKRIVVTRAREQGTELAESLEELGAEVILGPMIRIEPPTDPAPLRKAVEAVASFDWIVFTSANGVLRFWCALRDAGLDTRALAGVSICAIGQATAAALEREGASADLVPPEFVAESVAAALREVSTLAGLRILLPRAEVARDILPRTLRESGATVLDVPAYRNVAETEGVEALRRRLDAGEIDMVTFTSSSTVRNFADNVSSDLDGVAVASIGPITSGTIRELGWRVAVEAPTYTGQDLLAAIVAYYTGRSGAP